MKGKPLACTFRLTLKPGEKYWIHNGMTCMSFGPKGGDYHEEMIYLGSYENNFYKPEVFYAFKDSDDIIRLCRLHIRSFNNNIDLSFDTVFQGKSFDDLRCLEGDINAWKRILQ